MLRATRSFFVLLALFVGFGTATLKVSSVHAADCMFTAATNNDFNTDTNWSCGHVPTSVSSDTVTILTTFTANMSADAQFTTLTDLSGTLNVGTFGLTIDGTSAVNSGGILNIGSGVVTSTDNLTINSGGSIDAGSGTLVLLKNFVNSGSFLPGTSTVRYRGSLSSNDRTIPNVVFYNLNMNTSDASGSIFWATTSTVLGDLTVSSGSTFLNGSGSGDLTIVGNLNNAAQFSVSGASVTTTGNFINTGTFFGGSGPFALGGNLTNSDPVAFDPQYGVFVFFGGGSQTTDGVLFNDLAIRKTGSSVLALNASTTALGTLALSTQGIVDAQANNFTVVGTTNVAADNVITSTSGAMSFGGAVTLAGGINSASGDISFGSTLDNSGTLGIGSGTTSLTGNTTSTSAGTVNLGTGTLLVSGDLDLTSSTFTRGTGVMRFTGSSNQDIRPSTNATADNTYFNNIESTKSGGTVTFSNSANSSTILGYFTATSTAATSYSFGTLNLSVLGNTSLNENNTVTSTSGSFGFVGVVSSTAAIGTISGNMSFGSTVQNNGTMNLGSGNATSTGALANAASGTINANTATFALGGSFTNSGTFNRGTSTVKYVSNSASDVGVAEYYNLQLLGSATYSLSASTTAQATTTIASGATLAIGGNTFNAPGDISNSGLMTTSTSGVIAHPVDSLLFTNGSGSLITSRSSGEDIYVTLHDQNRNMDGTTQERVSISVTSNADAGSDSETLELTETSASSGVFRNTGGLNVRSATVTIGNFLIDLLASGTGTVAYVDTGDSTSTTVLLAYVTPSSSGSSGSSGGGGGGGGAFGYFLPTVPVQIVTSTIPVPATPSPVPVILPPVSVPAPSPTPSIPAPQNLLDLSDREGILLSLGLSRNEAAETRGLVAARTDAREFNVPISDTQASRLSLFIAYGVSPETRRLGEGERRALVRDMLETMQRADLSTEDMQRLTLGEIPRMRNLAVERQQLPRVRQTFRTLFGHDPNFQNPQENLAWNTLMYRIRFTRNLTLEQQGIREFRSAFGRSPSTPFQWAAVRVQGYVQR